MQPRHGGSRAHTNRPELVAVHGTLCGWGLQGVELLLPGRATLPVPEPHRSYLRAVRRGEGGYAEVLDAIAAAEAELTAPEATEAGHRSGARSRA